ncbi:hypothetical protein COB72_09325 [bacterium]|nr:MAG: hypothetical protein COB72_09325 [bacterium]
MVVLTGLSIGSGGGSGGRGKNGKQQRRAFMDSCVVTCDLHDRAHRRRRLIFDGFNPHCDDSWTLMPWGEINIPGRDLPGQVRRYHPSQMVGTGSRRIGFDSMFDAAADTAARLEAAGIELGWHTTRPGEFSKGELDRANAFKGMSRDYVRNTLEQVTTQEAITRDEIGD